LGLLLTQRTPREDPERWLFAAELSLDGTLRPVRGVVSFAIAAIAAGLHGVIVARENLREIEVLARIRMEENVRVEAVGFDCLRQVFDWLYEGKLDGVATISDIHAATSLRPVRAPANFDDMVLHPLLEKAALVSAVGLHSLLFARASR